MTDINAIRTLFWTSISLTGIWYLYFFLYRNYRTDAFRQDMFALRDELFDAAAGGLISFDHPAYGMLRSTMNGYIRFADRLNLLNILVIFFFIPSREMGQYSFNAKWRRFTENLEPETADLMNWYLARMQKLTAKKVLYSSPLTSIVLLLLCLPLLACGTIWTICHSCIRRLLDPLEDSVNSSAMAMGSVH